MLPVVPMFHANAWGLPYAAVMAGADLVMPDRFLQPEPLARLIEAERPTVAGAVPTIWNGAAPARARRTAATSRRCGWSPAAARPSRRSLMEAFEKELGVRIVQAWGMTETSPLGSVAHPPAGTPADEAWRYRDTAGPAGLRRGGPAGRRRAAPCCPTTARRSARSRCAAPG